MGGLYFTFFILLILCRIFCFVALPTRNCSWFEIYDPIIKLCQTVHCEEHCHFDLKTDLIQPVIIEKCRDNCFEKYVGIVVKACGAGRIYDRVGVCDNCQKCEFIEYTSLTEKECDYFCNYTNPDNSTRTVPLERRSKEEKLKFIITICLSLGSVLLLYIIIYGCIFEWQNTKSSCCHTCLNNDHISDNDVKDKDCISPTQCSSETNLAFTTETRNLLPSKAECESCFNTECNTSSEENHSQRLIIDVHRNSEEARLSDRHENPELCRETDRLDSKPHNVTHNFCKDGPLPVNDSLKHKNINPTPIGDPPDILPYPDTDATCRKLLNSSTNTIASYQPISEHTDYFCNYQSPKQNQDSAKTLTNDVRPMPGESRPSRYLSWSSDNPDVEIIYQDLTDKNHTESKPACVDYNGRNSNPAIVNQQADRLSEPINFNNVSQSRLCDLSIELDTENIVDMVSNVDTASTEPMNSNRPSSVNASIPYVDIEISDNVEVDVFPVQEEGPNAIQDEVFEAGAQLQADMISIGSSNGLSSGLGSLRFPLQEPGLTREEATVNEINELPQHLSLIPNIEDVFRIITRNNWARNVVSNGRYIRVRFDALNEDVVRQRIREQTGLNDRHFECIYDPSDSPFNSSNFNGHAYHSGAAAGF